MACLNSSTTTACTTTSTATPTTAAVTSITTRHQAIYMPRSYLQKPRYEITDEILAQTNLALETMPTVNIIEINALIYATVRTLQESVGEKRVSIPNTLQCLAVMAREKDQAIEIRCQ